MFFTRLNRTASPWKSADARIPWSASRHPARAQRADDRRRRRAHRATTAPHVEAALLERRSARARATNPAPRPARHSRYAVRKARGRPSADRQARSRIDAGQLRQVHQDLAPRPAPAAAARTDRASRSAVSPAANSADDRVDLVGERHRRPRHRRRAELLARRRRVGFDANRQVLVVDRLPDLLRQPFLARVDAAHRALQLGELEHHVGREIGLATSARPSPQRRPRRGWPKPRARSSGQPCDALGLLAIASELLVEQHRVQPIEPRLERRLAIRRPRRTSRRAAAPSRRARRSSRSRRSSAAAC